MNAERVYPKKKQESLAFLKSNLEEVPLLILVDYEGVSVEDINSIRRSFEAKGIKYIVAKNNIIKKAIEGTSKEDLAPFLKGMTGLVLSGEDGIEAAKVVRGIVKERKKKPGFAVKAGFFDGTVLKNENEVNKVADLPSKEELLATLLRTVQEGPRQILGVIQGPARDLVNLLKNYENQISEAE